MTTSSDRIQALVQNDTLPSEDAEALLAAVGAPARPRWRRWLLDPMDCFSAVQLTRVGLGVALVGIALVGFDVAFDGFLDIHLSGSRGAWPPRPCVRSWRGRSVPSCCGSCHSWPGAKAGS